MVDQNEGKILSPANFVTHIHFKTFYFLEKILQTAFRLPAKNKTKPNCLLVTLFKYTQFPAEMKKYNFPQGPEKLYKIRMKKKYCEFLNIVLHLE